MITKGCAEVVTGSTIKQVIIFPIILENQIIQVKMLNEQVNKFAREGGALRHGSLFSGI